MTRTKILKLAQNRMIAGSKSHGRWNPKNDSRDLYKEMIDELLDNINYSIMQIQKLSRRML